MIEPCSKFCSKFAMSVCGARGSLPVMCSCCIQGTLQDLMGVVLCSSLVGKPGNQECECVTG